MEKKFGDMEKNGFTLVEVLVAIVVGLVIMAAVYGTMTMAQRTSSNLGRKVVTQQDTRAVLDFMATEIRMASYNPQNAPETWSGSITGACNVTLTQLYKGIQAANANRIVIAMDLNNDGQIGCKCGTCCADNSCTSTSGCKGENEYIVYSYNNATNEITRNVNCAAVTPAILGGSAPDSNVRNLAAGVSLFRYFDRNNAEITNSVINTPASLVNGIPAIRRVLITIVADTAARDLNKNIPRRMIYSTNVIVRNHALSP
jgi:prepilin-type N-terminal cleavage/methylation domain-containing protein